jgi:WhiB family redox-sensing transcriptional regulator
MRNLTMQVTLPLLPNAACRSYSNPDIFFPTSKIESDTWIKIIRAICDSCVESKPCLEYAINYQINYGIWAGTTPEERDLIIETRLRTIAAMSKGAIQSTHKENDCANESCSLLESRQ